MWGDFPSPLAGEGALRVSEGRMRAMRRFFADDGGGGTPHPSLLRNATFSRKGRRARVILVAPAHRDFQRTKGHGTPGHRSRIVRCRSPGARARRFLSLASRTSRAALALDRAPPGAQSFLQRRAARSPSKQAARSYCRTGGLLGAFTSSTPAGFRRVRVSARRRLQEPPEARVGLVPRRRRRFPPAPPGTGPADALDGREREQGRIMFIIINSV
jgi:hypothetical protein